jgi:hypothetical protein
VHGIGKLLAATGPPIPQINADEQQTVQIKHDVMNSLFSVAENWWTVETVDLILDLESVVDVLN